LILAVAANPSIDRAVVIPDFRLGKIHRPEQVLSLAGGKGLNVARAIQRLGGEVKACLLLAGHNGHWIADQLEGEGILYAAAWGAGETRISTSIIDPKGGALTEIYERSEPVSPGAWAGFEQTLRVAAVGAAWATFSGSLPTGAPEDGFARLLQIMQACGVPRIVDTRGAYLLEALRAAPEIVKINAVEAAEAVGQEVGSLEAALQAAQALRRLGARTAIITLGEQGAIADSADGSWIGRAPVIQALAPVGSGDSFLGGLALALAHGDGLPKALRQAIAAGAANALTVGPAMIDARTVAELSQQVIIELA
jgi:1-phosphofructokinase family hexose kinase